MPGLDARSAYISSGTWSLVGVEIGQPVLSEEALRLNVTNEGGVGGTIRLLKNVAGLWLLQECQRHWQRAGEAYDWPALVALAGAARYVEAHDRGERTFGGQRCQALEPVRRRASAWWRAAAWTAWRSSTAGSSRRWRA